MNIQIRAKVRDLRELDLVMDELVKQEVSHGDVFTINADIEVDLTVDNSVGDAIKGALEDVQEVINAMKGPYKKEEKNNGHIN